jgi:ribosomal protein S11
LTGSGSVSTPTVAFTSTSYVWVYLGETTVTATSTGLTVTAWRSAGTGTSGVRVDRVAVTRTAARQASPQNLWDGARDHGEASLWDVRAEPTLIER